MNDSELLAVAIVQHFDPPFGTAGNPLANVISVFLQAAIVIAGITTVFLMIMGGFHIISGAGEGSPDRAAKGKGMLTSGVVGFVVILTAYWVVRIIELITGTTFITNPQLPGF